MKDYLQDLSRRVAAFDFERRYDARAAGGRFPAQTGDYEFWRRRATADGSRFFCNGFLEVKETAELYRLPKKNFDAAAIARLRKKELAGCEIVILVRHSALNAWRCPPFTIFAENPVAASWDLRPYPLWNSVEEAVMRTGYRSLMP